VVVSAIGRRAACARGLSLAPTDCVRGPSISLQQDALLASRAALLAGLAAGALLAHDARERLVKDVLEALAREGRALEVLEGRELLDHVVGLLVGDRRLAVLAQGLERRLIVAKISLGSDQNDRNVGAVVLDLRER